MSILLRWILNFFGSQGRVIDLGDGWEFTVDEYVEMEVDYSISVEEIAHRSNLSKEDWEYVGTAPSFGQRKVKALVGRLNRIWTEEQVVGLLAKPGCPLKGSGAWVREAYIELRPKYDSKGMLCFPEKETSRWRDLHDRNVCFPYLWSSGGRCRVLSLVGGRHGASSRLCLLVAE